MPIKYMCLSIRRPASLIEWVRYCKSAGPALLFTTRGNSLTNPAIVWLGLEAPLRRSIRLIALANALFLLEETIQTFVLFCAATGNYYLYTTYLQLVRMYSCITRPSSNIFASNDCNPYKVNYAIF